MTGDIDLIKKTVHGWFDLLKSSNQMGINIFVTVKEYMYKMICGA